MSKTPPQISKACGRCKAVLPTSGFYKDRSRKDGLTSQCRTCKLELSKSYASRHPDAMRANQDRYDAAHPERRAEIQRRWREKNPDWSAENNRKWREANPDGARLWYEANKDRVREASLRRDARLRAASRSAEPIDFDLLWLTNDGICPLCSVAIDRALAYPDPNSASVDHIVPLSKGGTHEQSNVQWTHLVCNKKKGARMAAPPQPAALALTKGA